MNNNEEKELIREMYVFVAMNHKATNPWRKALDKWQKRVEEKYGFDAFTEIENYKKQNMKKAYYCYGWFNGGDYGADKQPDCSAYIFAENESEAEDKADEYFKDKYGECAVILAQEKGEK